MVRKGTSIPGSVFLIGLLIVAAIDLSYISINIGPFGNPDTIRGVTLHQEYYTMDNALGLAGLYLDTGLRYSVYQAMHDNGMTGGFSDIPEENLLDGNVYWYLNRDILPDEQALLEALEAPAMAGLNRYTQSDYVFLDTYEVRLPQYTGLDMNKSTGGEILVNATAESNLWTRRVMENLDVIELEKKPDLEENLGDAYLGLYQKALARLGEVKEKFTEAVALIDTLKEGTLTKEQGGSQPQVTGGEVFLKALGDAGITADSKEAGEEGLGARALAVLNGLRDQGADSGGDVVRFERDAGVSLKSTECGNPQHSQSTEAGAIIYITTLSCTFEYEYNLTVNVSVTDTSREYPVFDAGKEEIALRPLTMAFSALEKSE